MPPRTKLLKYLVVSACCLVLVACGSDEGDQGESGNREFQAQAEAAIEQAKAEGASPAQIAILEEARRTGELSWEAYSASVDSFLRCVREAGLRVDIDEVDVHQGLMRRIYGVEVGENLEHEPTVQACSAKHSRAVERLWQIQPASVEAQERQFKQIRDAVVECLTREGVTVNPEWTKEDLEVEAVAVMERTGTNCLHVTG